MVLFVHFVDRDGGGGIHALAVGGGEQKAGMERCFSRGSNTERSSRAVDGWEGKCDSVFKQEA